MTLPDTFTCARNIWDKDRNCCKAPEQTWNSDSDAEAEAEDQTTATTDVAMTTEQLDALPMLTDVVKGDNRSAFVGSTV